MRTLKTFDQVYLCREPVDFRRSLDGLVAIVVSEFKADPYKPALFAFTNRYRDRVRLLYWDRTGFALWYKRLEEHHFPWPRDPNVKSIVLTPKELGLILDGIDIARARPHPTLSYTASL